VTRSRDSGPSDQTQIKPQGPGGALLPVARPPGVGTSLPNTSRDEAALSDEIKMTSENGYARLLSKPDADDLGKKAHYLA
jgi:hypothetical protein